MVLDLGPLLAIRPLLEEAHEAVCVHREKGREGSEGRAAAEREERKFDRPPRPRSLEEDGERGVADTDLLPIIEHELHDLRE